ncbi:N-acetyltransferase [Rhodovarius crocodyli]|uniref:N-acetyltransferase n=1 Tax=Rhodovarius crocodyli TaxID=1979269 RepID=A0A437ME08_9PROT|nr:GNAT family N-acetyltransferase [Rhodovarius crocodyli]RVT95891.1 N-acetyltransferase [Rhodovarius crocodyli]
MNFRPFTAGDIPAAHALSQSVGWPHRLEDWSLMAGCGEGLALGDLSACALFWRMGEAAASIGLVMVDPARQGQGIGRRLMQAVLEPLAGCSVSLVSTRAGEPLYRSLGFEPSHRQRQHQGVALETAPLAATCPGDLDSALALDMAAHGAGRAPVLRALWPVSQAVMLADGSGYALRRPFGKGEVIGPVIAPDLAGAQALIAALLRPGAYTRLDILADDALSAWLTGLGLPMTSEPQAMRLGRALPRRGVFALASQAFG